MERIIGTISDLIEQKVGDVRFEGLDISFGELLSLYHSNELLIDPDYQRLFRWSRHQQSRLIESILLGLPIPQLFVTENQDGQFELIDGLQRVSSVIRFSDSSPIIPTAEPQNLDMEQAQADDIDSPGYDNRLTTRLKLEGCDIVPDLNGLTSEDLPLSLRLRLKRASVRLIIIKKQSKPMLRYEMFKRLNTGGLSLSEQEIRNVTARIMGEAGIRFYDFLVDCARQPDFLRTIETMALSERDRKQDEELVLRFFALANWPEGYRGNISDFLTDYMELVTVKTTQQFDLHMQREMFETVFGLLNRSLGPDAFLRNRDGRFLGAVAPAYYEAVTQGVFRFRNELEKVSPQALAIALTSVRTDPIFLDNVGPGANSRRKLLGRIGKVKSSIEALLS